MKILFFIASVVFMDEFKFNPRNQGKAKIALQPFVVLAEVRLYSVETS